jgi:signal transduction histidine kinase
VADAPAGETGLVTDALLRLDPDWRLVEVNGRGAALLGRSASDLRGRVVWDVFPAVRDTELPGALHDAAETGRPRTLTVAHERRGTSLEVHVLPTGEGVTVTVHERAPDDGPAPGRARLVALVDRPAFAVDETGRFTDANAALADAVDRDRTALLGAPATETVGGIASALRTAITTVATEADVGADGLDPESDAVETATVTLRAGTADRRRYEARVAPAPDEGAVCVLRDLTVPQGRRQRLAVLDRVLRHDLRTEMNVIRGRLHTVADNAATTETREAVDAIERSVDSLLSVSRDVRRFADALDPEVGDPRPYDAATEVGRVVTEVRRRHPEADVRYLVRDEPEMCAHESALVAVEELLENAVEHGAAGSRDESGAPVRVTVSAVETDRGPTVRIEVADDGDGLPEPEQQVLVGREETPLDHASGVGLWMVNWAARKSGGDLSYASPDGQGAVITLDLPRPVDGDC